MKKLTDMRFFQALKYPSESEADMQKIEEYYEEFIEVLFQKSKSSDDLIDFYNQQCYVRVELKDLVDGIDYIDQHLPKNKCIKKALELLELQLILTENRLKPTFQNHSNKTSPHPNTDAGIEWTGLYAELVELGYGLQATKSINNGHLDIKTIMELLGNTFNTKIKDYYHVYHKMKYRAGDQTIFLDKLKVRLIDKIKDDLK